MPSNEKQSPMDFQNHSCHRDDRGIIMYCDFEVNGRRYITFPGDFPPEDSNNMPDQLYRISQYDGGDPTKEKGGTRITAYGKPEDAYATDPVEKFVIDGHGNVVEYAVIHSHTGNQGYWSVPWPDRGTLFDPYGDKELAKSVDTRASRFSN